MLPEIISKNIIKYRKQYGWSQSELARKAGVTSAAISKLEDGKRNPSLPVLFKICEAFNIPAMALVDMKVDENCVKDVTNIFYTKWRDIENLSEDAQKLIQLLIKNR
jgi:transcriptional regulator with XRE-family HTH domain